MQATDLLVEVRAPASGNPPFSRVGVILPKDMDLEISPVVNGVGTWSIKLPRQHAMHDHLDTPGAGIVVSAYGRVIFSGIVDTPETEASSEDRGDITTFTGVSDITFLWDRLAYPDPSVEPQIALDGTVVSKPGFDYDEYVEVAPDLLIASLVDKNAGSQALPSRAVNLLRVPVPAIEWPAPAPKASGRYRFDNLGEKIAEIADAHGIIMSLDYDPGDSGFNFTLRKGADLSSKVRLSIDNNTLASYKMAKTAPTATHVITGQAEENFDRLFDTVTVDDLTAADTPEWETIQSSANDWGRRIERFVDMRQARGDIAASGAQAREILVTEGGVTTSLQGIPIDDTLHQFGKDWDLGDTITVMFATGEADAQVTGYVLKANSDGVMFGVVLGDAKDFEPMSALRRDIANINDRVSNVERWEPIVSPGGIDETYLDPVIRTDIDAAKTRADEAYDLAASGSAPTEAPTSSPVITAFGTTSTIVIKAENVPVGTLLSYHVTDNPPIDGNGEFMDFTPTSTTLVDSATYSTIMTIKHMPNGDPLQDGIEYALRVVASNEIGSAPAGPQVTAGLDSSRVDDLVIAQITSGSIEAANLNVGPNISLNPDTGLTIETVGGTTNLPADGSVAQFAGDMETNRLTVQDNMTVNGAQNTVNGSLYLKSVVDAPDKAPLVYSTYTNGGFQQIQATGHLADGTRYLYGLTDNAAGTEWVTTHWWTTGGGKISRINSETGAPISEHETLAEGGNIGANITRIGNEYFIVGEVAGRLTVLVHDDVNFKLKRQWDVVSMNWVPANASIGVVNGEIAVVHARNNGADMRVRTYNPATGVETSTYTLDLMAYFGVENTHQVSDIGTVFGGAYLDTTTYDQEEVMYVVVSEVVLLYDMAGNFIERLAPESTYYENVQGIMPSSDKKFVTILRDNTDWVYTMPTSRYEAPIVFGFTWYDSNPAGDPGPRGDGTHETTLSPTISTKPSDWHGIYVNVSGGFFGSNEDEPNSWILYMNGWDHEAKGFPAGLKNSILLDAYRPVIADADPDKLAPPISNEFVSVTGNPGNIRSHAADSADDPLIDLNGDGTWRLGGLNFDGLTPYTHMDDPLWLRHPSTYTTHPIQMSGTRWHVVGSSGEPAFQNGWTKVSENVAFLKDAAGTVHIRGRVMSGPQFSTVFTLPGGFRPAEQVRFMVEAQGAGNNANVIVRQTGEVDINTWTGSPNYISLTAAFTTF